MLSKNNLNKTDFRFGFTLVELMVVISIIGLLSSIVLSSLNTAKDNSKMASSRQFDANIKHGIGDQLVGEWTFDECSGSSVTDYSGFNNTGTFSTTPPTFSTNTYKTAGCSMLFGGSSWIYSTNLSSLQSPSVTFSAWVYPTDVYTGFREIISKELQYKYRIHNGILAAVVSCNGTSWGGGSIEAGTVKINQWSMTTFVVDSTKQKISLFINGNLVGSGNMNCPVVAYNTNPITIGAYGPSGGEQFLGYIDDARFYSASLLSTDIDNLYAEGKNRHQNMATK